MAIAAGKESTSLNDILSKVTEVDILSYYLGILEIPTFIRSPLREDKRPSFGLYTSNGKRVYYKDLSTGDTGGIYDLLGKMWGLNFIDVLAKINKDIPYMKKGVSVRITTPTDGESRHYNTNTQVNVKVRDWKDWDTEYWGQFGITLDTLKKADVYPVAKIFITKNGVRNCYSADKLAYVYVEHKENQVTLKVYQPERTTGNGKWINKHDRSVISLWTKIPKEGDKLCICSSVKDALCLWEATKIPCIAVQGEGYTISETAINELKRRFKDVYILFDNDEAGLKDGIKLSESTGFTNLVIPQFEGGKDLAELYKTFGKKGFIEIIEPLFYIN